MDIETAAIVLCAGVGSRMGAAREVNKCALPVSGTTAARHTVSALLRAGIDKIAVVVGHASNSVTTVLDDFARSGHLEFVDNPYHNYHGCNYSISRGFGSECIGGARRVIIAEGDSFLHSASVDKLARSTANAASLIRDASFIDYARSVVAIGSNGKISRYEYDAAHSGEPPKLSGDDSIIGESMQLWSFSGELLRRLKELLWQYGNEARKSATAFTHSGIYTINQLATEIEPIVSDYPDAWINLNTQQDVITGRGAKWLTR
jgi:CTP:molybdopterin cytidylyltransferase MocA